MTPALLSALLLQTAPLVVEPRPQMSGASVEAVDRAPFVSGVFAAWHRVTVRTRGGASMALFTRSFSGDEPLPRPGQVCAFEYHAGGLADVEGIWPASGGQRLILDRFFCDPPAGDSAT